MEQRTNMAAYRLLSKTIKPKYKVHSQLMLDAEAAKKHPDYPILEWDQHTSRFHVKINQSIDKTYIVSAIDDEDYEELTNRKIIVTQEDDKVISGVDAMHMDPDRPAEFRSKLSEIVFSITHTSPNYNGIFVDNVMMYLRCLGLRTKVDDHWFITLDFGIEEIYGCYEGVGDNW